MTRWHERLKRLEATLAARPSPLDPHERLVEGLTLADVQATQLIHASRPCCATPGVRISGTACAPRVFSTIRPSAPRGRSTKTE